MYVVVQTNIISVERQRRIAETPALSNRFDTRDAHVANRQIISDDEGEYVDFEEEK